MLEISSVTGNFGNTILWSMYKLLPHTRLHCNKHMEKWSVETISRFVQRWSSAQAAQILKKGNVDGKTLLDLPYGTLLSEYCLNPADASSIMDKLAKKSILK